MTILLRLDADAMNALFPEGTKARVDLQQAVIAEFMRKHIKPGLLGAKVIDQINIAKDEMVQKVLHDHGVCSDTWGRVELKNEAKAIINEATRKVMREEISTAADHLRGTIKEATQASVNRMIDAEIREAVKARFAAVMEQMGKGGV